MIFGYYALEVAESKPPFKVELLLELLYLNSHLEIPLTFENGFEIVS